MIITTLAIAHSCWTLTLCWVLPCTFYYVSFNPHSISKRYDSQCLHLIYEETEAETISIICPGCGDAGFLIKLYPRLTPELKCTHPGINLVRRQNYTIYKEHKNFNKHRPVHCSLIKIFNIVKISILFKLLYIFNVIQTENSSKILFPFFFSFTFTRPLCLLFFISALLIKWSYIFSGKMKHVKIARKILPKRLVRDLIPQNTEIHTLATIIMVNAHE